MNSHRLCPAPLVIAVLLAAWSAIASAQVVPATPKGFTTRTTGGGSSSNVGVISQPKPQEKTVRTISYISLSEPRQWKSSDEKSLLGKLIAFEDLVVETKIAADAKPTPATPPQMPDHPSVVRDAKARLLIDHKPFEVALARLSEDDQKFIENIRASMAASTTKKN